MLAPGKVTVFKQRRYSSTTETTRQSPLTFAALQVRPVWLELPLLELPVLELPLLELPLRELPLLALLHQGAWPQPQQAQQIRQEEQPQPEEQLRLEELMLQQAGRPQLEALLLPEELMGRLQLEALPQPGGLQEALLLLLRQARARKLRCPRRFCRQPLPPQ